MTRRPRAPRFTPCPRLFDASDSRSHGCKRKARHHGRHLCPRCGVEWLSKPGPGPGKVVRPL